MPPHRSAQDSKVEGNGPDERELVLKECENTGSRGAAETALKKELFNQWLASARGSDDIRNRIAVAGGNLTHGVFGKCYLLVPDKPPIELNCAGVPASNLHGNAANDSEFEPTAMRKTNL